MSSVNKAIVLGYLGRDPETRYSADGAAITNVSVATSMQWKDKATGDKREATEWHRVSFFGRLAEVAAEYLRKGSQVYIEGRLQTRKWTDKDGAERYTTEIIAEEMKLLGRSQQEAAPSAQERQQRSAGPTGAQSRAATQAQAPQTIEDLDQDVPF